MFNDQPSNFMFDDSVYLDPPLKLREVITDGWVFPVDYPVVDNTHTPDASRTLRDVIAYSIVQYYKDHRVCSYNIDYFSERLASRLYNKMSQHQYWIDQYLGLIDDSQFFYNDEWNDGGTTNSRTTSSTSRTSDTPQNMIGDINNYLTDATVDGGTETSTNTTNLHIKKSTLGDITVQFRNFAEFPDFIDVLIKAVSPCFIQFYGSEDIDYGTTS
jgi:hypothetical protein